MTEAVIFDMDGLMFDSERLVQLSWTLSEMCIRDSSKGDWRLRFLWVRESGDHIIYGLPGTDWKRRVYGLQHGERA